MILTLIPWFLLGTSAALFNYITRLWTVMHIQPKQKSRGMILVFTGALVRLLISGLSIYIALRAGIFAALSVVVGLWIMRWLLALTNGLNIPKSLRGHKITGS